MIANTGQISVPQPPEKRHSDPDDYTRACHVSSLKVLLLLAMSTQLCLLLHAQGIGPHSAKCSNICRLSHTACGSPAGICRKLPTQSL